LVCYGRHGKLGIGSARTGEAGKVGHVTDCFGRGGKAGKAGRGWVSLGVVG